MGPRSTSSTEAAGELPESGDAFSQRSARAGSTRARAFAIALANISAVLFILILIDLSFSTLGFVGVFAGFGLFGVSVLSVAGVFPFVPWKVGRTSGASFRSRAGPIPVSIGQAFRELRLLA